jgi:hypothetical protein
MLSKGRIVRIHDLVHNPPRSVSAAKEKRVKTRNTNLPKGMKRVDQSSAHKSLIGPISPFTPSGSQPHQSQYRQDDNGDKHPWRHERKRPQLGGRLFDHMLLHQLGHLVLKVLNIGQ